MKLQMRIKRQMLQPKPKMLQPKWQQEPNRYLSAHLKVYPQYLDELGNGAYNPKLDPYINPMLRLDNVIPNCPDGRYRA